MSKPLAVNDADFDEKVLKATNPVFVDFWATWCAPCVREMPALDRLQAGLTGEKIVVVALSIDRGGLPVVEEFYRRNGIETLPARIVPPGPLIDALGITVMPTTLLVNGDGNEVGRVVGTAEWDLPGALSFLRGCLVEAPASASVPGSKPGS